MRHLFLAMSGAAFGEATVARRLALELHARGDEIVVLGSSDLHSVWRDAPVTFGAIDAIANNIHDALPGVIAKQRCDDLVLVDLTATIVACRLYGIDPQVFSTMPVPVIALDLWNLPDTDRRWDVGGRVLDVSGFDSAARLVAVPFARPDAAGAYCALPATIPAVVKAPQTQILITTAAWQTAPRGVPSAQYSVVPERWIEELATLDANVVHVGPTPLARAERLGARYHWRGRVSPEEMCACVARSDLLVTLNIAATTIGTALAAGVPTVVAINSADLEEVPRFAIWPLGLHAFLSPVLADNPYMEAVCTAELMVRGALATACRALLFDDVERATSIARIAAYVARVRELPSGASVLSSLL